MFAEGIIHDSVKEPNYCSIKEFLMESNYPIWIAFSLAQAFVTIIDERTKITKELELCFTV
jgi:hypothetical protein